MQAHWESTGWKYLGCNTIASFSSFVLTFRLNSTSNICIANVFLLLDYTSIAEISLCIHLLTSTGELDKWQLLWVRSLTIRRNVTLQIESKIYYDDYKSDPYSDCSKAFWFVGIHNYSVNLVFTFRFSDAWLVPRFLSVLLTAVCYVFLFMCHGMCIVLLSLYFIQLSPVWKHWQCLEQHPASIAAVFPTKSQLALRHI